MVITYLVTITGGHGVGGWGTTGQRTGHNQGESLLHMPGGGYRGGQTLFIALDYW